VRNAHQEMKNRPLDLCLLVSLVGMERGEPIATALVFWKEELLPYIGGMRKEIYPTVTIVPNVVFRFSLAGVAVTPM
jgi:hypothetical protein